MSKCRFIALGDGQVYTTANELGHYLETRGLKFPSDDVDSRHFGTKFNATLSSLSKKNVQYWESFPYSTEDFPKLVTKDNDGTDVTQNKRIVDILLRNRMCEPSSVAVLNKGSAARGLDLYTIRAVRALIAYYGSLYHISLIEDDIEFICYCDDVPHLQKTTRKGTIVSTSNKNKLIPV